MLHLTPHQGSPAICGPRETHIRFPEGFFAGHDVTISAHRPYKAASWDMQKMRVKLLLLEIQRPAMIFKKAVTIQFPWYEGRRFPSRTPH
jgi:hypothetical protein